MTNKSIIKPSQIGCFQVSCHVFKLNTTNNTSHYQTRITVQVYSVEVESLATHSNAHRPHSLYRITLGKASSY